MTTAISDIVTRLKSYGYDLYLEGSTLRYKCLALLEPPKDKVLPLLDTLKRNKQAVIEYLKPKNNHEAFDPDNILTEIIAFYEDEDNGNEMIIDHIDQMIADGMLKPPYGFKVKGGHIGDYWIISDTIAREKLPVEAMSFTIEELRPIVKTCKVLNGKVVEVKYKTEVFNEQAKTF